MLLQPVTLFRSGRVRAAGWFLQTEALLTGSSRSPPWQCCPESLGCRFSSSFFSHNGAAMDTLLVLTWSCESAPGSPSRPSETTEVVLEFYLLMFYFTGRFTWGREVARVEAWPFRVWRAENPFCWLLEAASCAFPELPSLPWQFRQTPGEMRAVAEKRSLYFRGCPLVQIRRFC